MAKKTFIFGFGNPGRQDDGLGPALAGHFEELGWDNVTVDINYQLNVEDALAIATCDEVIFADASIDGREPYTFTELVPARDIRFSSHSMNPDSILGLCHDLYNRDVKGYLLAIRGYSWNFMEPMTKDATRNCEEAVRFLENYLGSAEQEKHKLPVAAGTQE